MSGNAALAAARRRRGEDPTQNIEPLRSSMKQTQNQNQFYDTSTYNRDPDTKMTPVQCILEHDKQIWILERKMDSLEQGNINNNGLSSETENLITTNNSEIRLLKSTLQKQQK